MIYPRDRKWYERPLRCVLGLHKFFPHPGGINWKCCSVCDGEKEVR